MIATAGLFLEVAKGATCDTSRLPEPQSFLPQGDPGAFLMRRVGWRSKLLRQGADLQAGVRYCCALA